MFLEIMAIFFLIGRCVKKRIKNVQDLRKISMQFLLYELFNPMNPTNMFLKKKKLKQFVTLLSDVLTLVIMKSMV